MSVDASVCSSRHIAGSTAMTHPMLATVSGDKIMCKLVAEDDKPIGVTFARLVLVLEEVQSVKKAEVAVEGTTAIESDGASAGVMVDCNGG